MYTSCRAAPSYVHTQYRCVMHRTLLPPSSTKTDTVPVLDLSCTCKHVHAFDLPRSLTLPPPRPPSSLPYIVLLPRLSSLITRRGFVRGSNGGKASLVAGILYRLLQVTIRLVHQTCSRDRPGFTIPSLPTVCTADRPSHQPLLSLALHADARRKC